MKSRIALIVWLLVSPAASWAEAAATTGLERRLDEWIASRVLERDLAGAVLIRRGGDTDAGDGRGFGVEVFRRGARRVIGHDGVTCGDTAFFGWYPGKKEWLLNRPTRP